MLHYIYIIIWMYESELADTIESIVVQCMYRCMHTSIDLLAETETIIYIHTYQYYMLCMVILVCAVLYVVYLPYMYVCTYVCIGLSWRRQKVWQSWHSFTPSGGILGVHIIHQNITNTTSSTWGSSVFICYTATRANPAWPMSTMQLLDPPRVRGLINGLGYQISQTSGSSNGFCVHPLFVAWLVCAGILTSRALMANVSKRIWWAAVL